jgi:acyl-CoA thioesterase YciA
MNTSKARTPLQGELSLRVVAMPADTNLSGQVFGGWMLGHRWICPGSIHAVGRQPGERVVTIALEAMMFHKPVHVGWGGGCFTTPRIVLVGRTSISVMLETWVRRSRLGASIHVTEGLFT